MCAQYLLHTTIDRLRKSLGLPLIGVDHDDFTIDLRILPYRLAPIVRGAPAGYQLIDANFSLIPSWAKEPKMKFATHNARIETVLEKPTWKKPFVKSRCVIPISRFVEPIYTNQFAGNMVRFFSKAEDLLWAAGIFDEWIHRDTGEVITSFSIITKDPPGFIFETGHDRCPLFLKPAAFSSWLDAREAHPEILMNTLLANEAEHEFFAEIDRPMAKGWEKRIPKDETEAQKSVSL